MSVIVKCMEMPNNCEECTVYVSYETWSGDHGCFCGLTKRDILNPKKIEDLCPLIEIPPHGKSIDADRLLTDRMKSIYYHLPNGDIAIPIIDIEHAPTVLEEEAE
jgi:hypothetical protein